MYEMLDDVMMATYSSLIFSRRSNNKDKLWDLYLYKERLPAHVSVRLYERGGVATESYHLLEHCGRLISFILNALTALGVSPTRPVGLAPSPTSSVKWNRNSQ